MRSLWIVASAALIYLLQSVLYAKAWKRGLQVQLRFVQEAIREGDQGELKEVVQNGKRLPLPFLQVDLQSHRSFHFTDQKNTAVSDQVYRRDIYSLLPYQQITRTLAFVGTKRGYYPCQEVELVGRTLFFEGPFVDRQPQETALYVYPRAICPEQVRAACQEMLGEHQWKKKLFEDPFSFRGIRDYGPGDSFRQVNWKAFARTGELKVNVYEHVAMAKVQILLNVKGDQIWTEELLLEGGIRIGAAMAEQWIGLGIPVGLRTNGRDVLTGDLIEVKPGAGPGHVTQVLQALSRIDLTGPQRTGRIEAEPLGAETAVRQGAVSSREDGWLWEGIREGLRRGETGGLFLYIAVSSREEDLTQLEHIRQSGAVVRWIRPCTWRQEEQRRATGLEKTAGQNAAEELEGTAKQDMTERQKLADAGKGRSQDTYRGQIIEWRVEG